VAGIFGGFGGDLEIGPKLSFGRGEIVLAVGQQFLIFFPWFWKKTKTKGKVGEHQRGRVFKGCPLCSKLGSFSFLEPKKCRTKNFGKDKKTFFGVARKKGVCGKKHWGEPQYMGTNPPLVGRPTMESTHISEFFFPRIKPVAPWFFFQMENPPAWDFNPSQSLDYPIP